MAAESVSVCLCLSAGLEAAPFDRRALSEERAKRLSRQLRASTSAVALLAGIAAGSLERTSQTAGAFQRWHNDNSQQGHRHQNTLAAPATGRTTREQAARHCGEGARDETSRGPRPFGLRGRLCRHWPSLGCAWSAGQAGCAPAACLRLSPVSDHFEGVRGGWLCTEPGTNSVPALSSDAPGPTRERHEELWKDRSYPYFSRSLWLMMSTSPL